MNNALTHKTLSVAYHATASFPTCININPKLLKDQVKMTKDKASLA